MTPDAKPSAQKRDRSFTRDYGNFDGLLRMKPEGDVAKVISGVLQFDFTRIAGFSSMNLGTRVLFVRAVANELTKAFSDCDKGIPDAVTDMSLLFDSIIDGSYTHGRGVSAVTSNAPLIAAILVALQYNFMDREDAEAHPNYPAVLEIVKQRAQEVEAADAEAETIADPTERKIAEKKASRLLYQYNALTASDEAKAIRNRWAPQKVRAKKVNSKVSDIFANLG
jgi:hypothetical protein